MRKAPAPAAAFCLSPVRGARDWEQGQGEHRRLPGLAVESTGGGAGCALYFSTVWQARSSPAAATRMTIAEKNLFMLARECSDAYRWATN